MTGNDKPKPSLGSRLFAMGTGMVLDGIKGSAGKHPSSTTGSNLAKMIINASISGQEKAMKRAKDAASPAAQTEALKPKTQNEGK
ncbi:MAG: hypothetical protein EOM59_12855 [Clostridia bacterium]|nr:hypothetical protein [Clostridia bacterium]